LECRQAAPHFEIRLANPPRKKGKPNDAITVFGLHGLAVLIARNLEEVPKEVRFAALALMFVKPPSALHIHAARRLSGSPPISEEHALSPDIETVRILARLSQIGTAQPRHIEWRFMRQMSPSNRGREPCRRARSARNADSLAWLPECGWTLACRRHHALGIAKRRHGRAGHTASARAYGQTSPLDAYRKGRNQSTTG